MNDTYSVDTNQVEKDAMNSFLNRLRSYPCLYNRKFKEFHITEWHDNAVADIARTLHEPGTI